MNTVVYELSRETPKSDMGDERRSMLSRVPRRSGLADLTQESVGYAWFPPGALRALPDATSFAQQVLEERRLQASPDPRGFRTSDLLAAKRYEDAPAFFELALSDELIQVAADYLGEIPVLSQPRLWWTKPTGPNARLGGTQMFHIGSRHRPPVLRQAKFLFNMNDVDEENGPFTFLSAEISDKIVAAVNYELGEEVADEEIYRYAKPGDTMRLIGPAGTGLFVDTCRCFHFGRRASTKERLMLMIQFKRPVEMPEYDRVERSPAFLEKFSDDPVRMLVVPEW